MQIDLREEDIDKVDVAGSQEKSSELERKRSGSFLPFRFLSFLLSFLIASFRPCLSSDWQWKMPSSTSPSKSKMYSDSQKSEKKSSSKTNDCCGVSFLKYVLYIFNLLFWVREKGHELFFFTVAALVFSRYLCYVHLLNVFIRVVDLAT